MRTGAQGGQDDNRRCRSESASYSVGTQGRQPETLEVISGVTEDSIIDEIESSAAQAPFVIVDLEGTASMLVAYAISRADLVIIPTHGSQLDANEAAKAIRLIRQQEKAFSRKIPFSVLFTRTSHRRPALHLAAPS